MQSAFLVVLSSFRKLQLAITASNTAARSPPHQGRFHYFIYGLRNRSPTMASVGFTRLASGDLRIGFGFLPGKRCSLAFARPQGFFQSPPQTLILSLQSFDLSFQTSDLF